MNFEDEVVLATGYNEPAGLAPFYDHWTAYKKSKVASEDMYTTKTLKPPYK